MNSNCPARFAPRILFSSAAVLLALGFGSSAQAQKAGASLAANQQIVSCLLPGQIRHGVNGAPMLSPRRSVRTSAADCQLRGGEYVVAVVPKPVAPAAATRRPEDLVVVRCLLPDQVRQLGTKVTYVKVQRPARIARWECQKRSGQSVSLVRYQEAQRVYVAAVAKSRPVTKKP